MHLKKENLASDVLKNTLERLVIIFLKQNCQIIT